MIRLLIFIITAVILYSMSSSGTIADPQQEKSCLTDRDCHSSEFCINFNCINACGVRNCSETKVCQVQNHRASCSCPIGYKINRKTHECVKEEMTYKPCSNNDNCNSRQICKYEMCVDACADRKCRKFQACVSENHQSSCHCISGFVRNTTSNECQRQECESNMECPGHQVCQLNADGIHSCKCMDGHTRNEEGTCKRKCYVDSDCLDNETCAEEICGCINGKFNYYSWYDQVKECRKEDMKSLLSLFASLSSGRI